jgi:16S rRNA (guanine527-N7)-methyltransferase
MSFDFKGRLAVGLSHLDLDLSDTSFDLLEKYFNELKKWNRKVNLIARLSSDEHILENHFVDSLTILPFLEKPGTHLLDVGAGAGFPGLVCKAACPGLKLTLVEPRQKKVSFLRHIIRTLGLTDVMVLDCRIEDEDRLSSTASFTHITGRAVSDIKVFMGMVQRFADGGARVICMKGPKWQEEVAEAAEVVHGVYTREKVIEQALPFSGARRVLLVYVPI